MGIDYMSFEYGQRNGTILTKDEFYSEHSDINITPTQIERLEQNLEVQCILILKAVKKKEIASNEFYNTFINKTKTGELYLKPLNINIIIFFKILKSLILIYDIKMD